MQRRLDVPGPLKLRESVRDVALGGGFAVVGKVDEHGEHRGFGKVLAALDHGPERIGDPHGLEPRHRNPEVPAAVRRPAARRQCDLSAGKSALGRAQADAGLAPVNVLHLAFVKKGHKAGLASLAQQRFHAVRRPDTKLLSKTKKIEFLNKSRTNT